MDIPLGYPPQENNQLTCKLIKSLYHLKAWLDLIFHSCRSLERYKVIFKYEGIIVKSDHFEGQN